MAYRIRRLNAAFTRALQFLVLISIFLRYILILVSHICLGLLKVSFLRVYPLKRWKHSYLPLWRSIGNIILIANESDSIRRITHIPMILHQTVSYLMFSDIYLSSTMRNFIVCTVHLIQSGWLNLEDWDGEVL